MKPAGAESGGAPAESALLRLRIFDGARAPVAESQEHLVRILDGDQRQLFAEDLTGHEQLFELPFKDSLADRYTVLVSASGASDSGFHPVTVNPNVPAILDLMLLPKPPVFDFERAAWDRVRDDWPAVSAALSFGVSADAARARYDALLQHPLLAASLWNILTTMRDVQLPQGTVLDYVREVTFDGSWRRRRSDSLLSPTRGSSNRSR